MADIEQRVTLPPYALRTMLVHNNRIRVSHERTYEYRTNLNKNLTTERLLFEKMEVFNAGVTMRRIVNEFQEVSPV